MRTKTRCPSISDKKVNKSRWRYNLALSLKSLTSWLEIISPQTVEGESKMYLKRVLEISFHRQCYSE